MTPDIQANDVKINSTHKLNPIDDNCSNDVSRDRSRPGIN